MQTHLFIQNQRDMFYEKINQLNMQELKIIQDKKAKLERQAEQLSKITEGGGQAAAAIQTTSSAPNIAFEIQSGINVTSTIQDRSTEKGQGQIHDVSTASPSKKCTKPSPEKKVTFQSNEPCDDDKDKIVGEEHAKEKKVKCLDDPGDKDSKSPKKDFKVVGTELKMKAKEVPAAAHLPQTHHSVATAGSSDTRSQRSPSSSAAPRASIEEEDDRFYHAGRGRSSGRIDRGGSGRSERIGSGRFDSGGRLHGGARSDRGTRGSSAGRGDRDGRDDRSGRGNHGGRDDHYGRDDRAGRDDHSGRDDRGRHVGHSRPWNTFKKLGENWTQGNHGGKR